MLRNSVIVALVAALALSLASTFAASDSARVHLSVAQGLSDPSVIWLGTKVPGDERFRWTDVNFNEASGQYKFGNYFLDVPMLGHYPGAQNLDVYYLIQAVQDEMIPGYRFEISNGALRQNLKWELDNLPSRQLANLAEQDRNNASRVAVALEGLRGHVATGSRLAAEYLEAAIDHWVTAARSYEAERLYMLSADDNEALARWELRSKIRTGAFAAYRLSYCEVAQEIYYPETAAEQCGHAFSGTAGMGRGDGGADGLLDQIQQRLGVN